MPEGNATPVAKQDDAAIVAKQDNAAIAEIYKEIARTDGISFQILGLIPLVSATGILGLLIEGKIAHTPIVFFISAFAAATTVAFLRWEMRNVQTCNWLRLRAAQLEHWQLPSAPGRWGKTEAEYLIYAITISAWVLLPFFVGPVEPKSVWLMGLTAWELAHIMVALWVFFMLVIAFRDSKETKKPDDLELQGLSGDKLLRRQKGWTETK